MANKKSAAQQAIKDMLASNMNIGMFIGEINSVHILNAEIGITEVYARKQKKVETKVEVKIKVNYMPPEVYKPAPRRRHVFINGVMQLFDDYDND